MFRHESTPPGWPPQCTFVIGWDKALGSFFALVIDTSIGRDESGIIASFGDAPPRFKDLDNLMRVVNARLRDRLPPVQLAGELRRELTRQAKADHPIINQIAITDPGQPERPPGPLTRPCRALGTCSGYLEGDELQDELDRMARRYFRLERLYQAKKAAGLSEANDAVTKRIRGSLGSLGMVCQFLSATVQVPGTLVASEALKPFQELAAEADRVLQADAAPAETIP